MDASEQTPVEAYRSLQSFFAERSREEAIPIAPLSLREESVSHTWCVHLEFMGDRILQISLPSIRYSDQDSADFWFSELEVEGADYAKLMITDTRPSRRMEDLWLIRRMWLTDRLPEEELTAYLENSPYRL